MLLTKLPSLIRNLFERPHPVAAAAAQTLAEAPACVDVPVAPEPFLVHREVLNERFEVTGVEFFTRGKLRGRLPQRESIQRFLDTMLLSRLANLHETPLGDRRVWVQLADTTLLRPCKEALPENACVLIRTSNPQEAASRELARAITSLQEAGHEIWLDNAIGTPWFDSLAWIAEGATLRLALRTPLEATQLFELAFKTNPSLRLGAWDTNSSDDFELARRMHCTRFSGSFVTRRDDWKGVELSPQKLTVARLVSEIRNDADFREIARVLRQDMALSYRLLRYANAAAFGLSQRITGIEHALVLLGQRQLDRWLTLLMLSGSSGGNTALTEIALTRARFLELAATPRLPPDQRESLFVLGLFSMLDVALKVPMEVAIRPLQLAESMSAALLRREGILGRYLALADACERGVASEIMRHALELGLTSAKISTLQLKAVSWVAELAQEDQFAEAA